MDDKLKEAIRQTEEILENSYVGDCSCKHCGEQVFKLEEYILDTHHYIFHCPHCGEEYARVKHGLQIPPLEFIDASIYLKEQEEK